MPYVEIGIIFVLSFIAVSSERLLRFRMSTMARIADAVFF
jgi:hypothetical protein